MASDVTSDLVDELLYIEQSGSALLREMVEDALGLFGDYIEYALDQLLTSPQTIAVLSAWSSDEALGNRYHPGAMGDKARLINKLPDDSLATRKIAFDLARISLIAHVMVKRGPHRDSFSLAIELNDKQSRILLQLARETVALIARCRDSIKSAVRLCEGQHELGRDSIIKKINIDEADEGIRAVLKPMNRYNENETVLPAVAPKGISIAIYLDTDNRLVQDSIVQQVQNLVNALGYKEGGIQILNTGQSSADPGRY